jgi:hypothetical protein
MENLKVMEVIKKTTVTMNTNMEEEDTVTMSTVTLSTDK